jgi:hypothetical protein
MNVDTERASKEAAPANSLPRSVVQEAGPKRSRHYIPVSLEPDPEEELPIEERPTHLTRVFQGDDTLPKGVHIIVLGGFPGSGVKTAGKYLYAALEAFGATVRTIDDYDFHVASRPCPICMSDHVLAKLRTTPSRCFACQDCLETEALFPAIVREAQLIAESEPFSLRALGFVIVQGRSVAGCAPLCALADGMIFYFGSDVLCNGPTAPLGFLRRVAARLDEILRGNDCKLWLFEHYRIATLMQKRVATRIITVNLKTIFEVATELTKKVQQRLLHTETVVIQHDLMWPGPGIPKWVVSASKEGKRVASASKEERLAALPSIDEEETFAALPSIDAPWNRSRAAAVAVAAVGGDWHTRKADLGPLSAVAPWNQPGYTSPRSFMQVARPVRCQPLSANMPKDCPPYPYSSQTNFHWQELSRAMNKALRHDQGSPSTSVDTLRLLTSRGSSALSTIGWSNSLPGKTYYQLSTTRTRIASKRCLDLPSSAPTS